MIVSLTTPPSAAAPTPITRSPPLLPACLPLPIFCHLLAQLFSSLTPKRCLCVGLKGLNVSAFTVPDHRRAVFNPVYGLASIWPGVLRSGLPPPPPPRPPLPPASLHFSASFTLPCSLSLLHPHPNPFVIGYECTLLVDNYTLLLCPSLSF